MSAGPADAESAEPHTSFSAELLLFLPRADSDMEFVLVTAVLMLAPSGL